MLVLTATSFKTVVFFALKFGRGLRWWVAAAGLWLAGWLAAGQPKELGRVTTDKLREPIRLLEQGWCIQSTLSFGGRGSQKQHSRD